jgi:hypothetical protein
MITAFTQSEQQIQLLKEEKECLEQELNGRLNIANINTLKLQFQSVQGQNQDLQRQNNELNNELMQLRNVTNTHIHHTEPPVI